MNLKLKVDSTTEQRAWWWDTVDSLREHTLISLSNIAGYLKVIQLANEVCKHKLYSPLDIMTRRKRKCVKSNLSFKCPCQYIVLSSWLTANGIIPLYTYWQVAFPLMDSLLFWVTTPAAYARDPLPAAPNLSIQTLVMEILCKMCAHSDNICMLLATPPWSRINSLFSILAKYLTEHDQVSHHEIYLTSL